MNSAALLLRSASDRHPARPGQRLGRRRAPLHAAQQRRADGRLAGAQPHAVPEDAGPQRLVPRRRRLGLPAGRHPDAGQGRRRAAPRQGAPGWARKVTPDWPFEIVAHHSVDFWLCVEDLPLPDNRVTLDPDGRSISPLDEKNNVEGLKRLRHKLDSMLGDLGMHQHGLLEHSSTCTRRCRSARPPTRPGTARFGTDPATSVLDVDCKAHELDNLYVVDSSFFVSIGAVNPTLTIIANALRVGDHLLDRLG